VSIVVSVVADSGNEGNSADDEDDDDHVKTMSAALKRRLAKV